VASPDSHVSDKAPIQRKQIPGTPFGANLPTWHSPQVCANPSHARAQTLAGEVQHFNDPRGVCREQVAPPVCPTHGADELAALQLRVHAGGLEGEGMARQGQGQAVVVGEQLVGLAAAGDVAVRIDTQAHKVALVGVACREVGWS